MCRWSSHPLRRCWSRCSRHIIPQVSTQSDGGRGSRILHQRVENAVEVAPQSLQGVLVLQPQQQQIGVKVKVSSIAAKVGHWVLASWHWAGESWGIATGGADVGLLGTVADSV